MRFPNDICWSGFDRKLCLGQFLSTKPNDSVSLLHVDKKEVSWNQMSLNLICHSSYYYSKLSGKGGFNGNPWNPSKSATEWLINAGKAPWSLCVCFCLCLSLLHPHAHPPPPSLCPHIHKLKSGTVNIWTYIPIDGHQFLATTHHFIS